MKKLKRRKGGRSSYRDEFYADVKPDQIKKQAPALTWVSASRRRKRKVPLYVPLFGLGFLLCIIAVVGSSAMIWLRKLGTLFGVEWSGDG